MSETPKRKARIFYARVDEFWRKEEKYAYLDEKQHRGNVQWQENQPDAKFNWLTKGMLGEFDAFLPIGDKRTKGTSTSETIFNTFSGGVKTNRDALAYNFSEKELKENIIKCIDAYNELVVKWMSPLKKAEKVDDLIDYTVRDIAWSRDLKLDLERGKTAEYSDEKTRTALYRPFTKSYLFFDRILNEEVYVLPRIFPVKATENENRAICVVIGSDSLFIADRGLHTLPTLWGEANAMLPLLHLQRRRHKPS